MLRGHRILDCSDRLGWLGGRILADLGAEVIKADPPGTDRGSPDWRANNVNKRLVEVASRAEMDRCIAGADAVLTGAGWPEGWLEPERLLELDPRLVVVAVTPWGRSGPRSPWRGTDLEIMAGSGAMSLAGEPDGPPLRVTAPQSYAWAGSHAAVGCLTALHHRARTGRGQVVDVSAQASVVIGLAHAPTFWDLLGVEPTRAGAYMTGRSVTGARYRVFWPCLDGYLNFILYGGSAGRRTNEQLVRWMKESGADPGPLAAIDWATFDPARATQAQVDAIEIPIARFFARLTKQQFLEEAHRREMLGYPVFTVADVAADPQLEARGFWQDLEVPDGRRERHCGAFVVVDGVRPPLPAGTAPRARAPTPRGTGDGGSARPQALEGLKVVEFGGYAAGPHAGKVLANFGATVVHVESGDRPDGFRMQYPPYKDGIPGVDRGACFAIFNDSKYGVTIDLKTPEGLEQARRLVDWCDVVIENMRPGVMHRLGLGYARLRKTNPALIMLSTCNMGQTGPRADTPGFGSQLSALAGFCGLTGERGGPPMLLYGPYIDFIASTLGATAILAALLHRAGSGTGVHLDQSQYECGLTFLAGALYDYHATGRVLERAGNDDPGAAPHGAFRCAEGEWLALSVWSDAEFAALARVIGREDLVGAGGFSDLAGRRQNGAAVRAAIESWSQRHRAGRAAEALQHAGVAAYPVNTISKLFGDPQLLARRLWRRRRHPVIGNHHYEFPGFDLSDSPGEITAPAPTLGQDNRTVLQELLQEDTRRQST